MLVYVPTGEGRDRGHRIIKQVLQRWKPPPHFFHFQDGGHVAACRYHRTGPVFARMDIQSFFPSVTRTKVHRALKRLGFSQSEALDITYASTVESFTDPGKYALPFGFVQSMVLASAALDCSHLGKRLRSSNQFGVKVSVYVDDILLSAALDQHLGAYIVALVEAGDAAGYRFNSTKMSSPSPVAEAFNICVSNNDLRVNAMRMAKFENVVRSGAPDTAAAVIRYVASVNRGQADWLSNLGAP